MPSHTHCVIPTSARPGAANAAAVVHHPNGLFVQWLQDQLTELKVDVRLNTTATVDAVDSLGADAVVIATGPTYRSPMIDGSDLPHVHDAAALPAMLLSDGIEREDRVVVIGGDLVGMQLTDFLHHRGQSVGLIDDTAQLGWGIAPARRGVMLSEMDETDIALHAGANAISIERDAVTFTDKEGAAVELRADTVIITKGAQPNTSLHHEFQTAGLETHLVGDCGGMGYIYGAVQTAANVAAQI